jgi:hypothetical protein
MSYRSKRKLGHRRHLVRPDRSSAFRMEVKDHSHGVLSMSLGFRSFQLIALKYLFQLEIILNKWKPEVQPLPTEKLK